MVLLPPSVLEHIESFLYCAEDTPGLRLLGRLAIAVRAPDSLRRARLAFVDLWERRDDEMHWQIDEGICFNRFCNSMRCRNGQEGYWSI